MAFCRHLDQRKGIFSKIPKYLYFWFYLQLKSKIGPNSPCILHANSVPSVCLGSYVRPRSRVVMLLEKFKNFGMNCSTTGPATESS